MSELLPRPQVWSDFDGTAVRLETTLNPSSWLSFRVNLAAGYLDFLAGIQSENVEVAGLISKRHELGRWATNRSVARLGLNEFFKNPEQIVLAGSEAEKGRFVARESRQAKVGMLEDNPHKIGAVLLNELVKSPKEQSVVLGVPPNIGAYESVIRLVKQAETAKIDRNSDGTVTISGESFRLGIVLLQQYSKDVGKDFAQRVLAG